jgi:hypothetical protein
MRIVAASAIALSLCAPALGERVKPGGQGAETSIFAPQQASTPKTPSTMTTTGSDVDGHGYVCRRMTLRREDGGITKIRRCAD